MASITGTSASESIQGTAGDDYIDGREGDDVIDGLEGDDSLDGGEGSDTVHGGDGNDQIWEVSSGDQIEHHQMFGDAGDDRIYFDLRSSFADTVLIDGGTGNDRIVFGAWNTLSALTLRGGDGDDSISIQGGNTLSVDGGTGADRIDLGYSEMSTSYSVTLGAGADILSLNRDPVFNNIGAAIHITDFEAGISGDRLIIDRLLSSLLAWDGVTNPLTTGHLALIQRGGDTVLQIDFDGGGNDLQDFVIFDGLNVATLTAQNLGFEPGGTAETPVTLTGGADADVFEGRAGADLLRGFDGADQLFGGMGNDQLEGGLGADTLEGGFGNDVLLGEQGDDKLYDYDAGDDHLLGGDGNDTLEVYRRYNAPAGTILLDGGAGDDTLYFAGLRYFQTRWRIDTVTVIGGDGNDNIRVRAAGVANVFAGTGDDVVNIGIDDTANFISLGSGSDTLTLSATDNRNITAVIVSDFEAGNSGDRLDLQNYLQYALTGWNQLNNPFEYGYLQRLQRGSDAVLQIDLDGAGSFYGMVDLVIFQNVSANSLTTLNLGGYATFIGTDLNDVIEGDSGNNTLRGLAGDDILNGNDGADFLDGGTGADVMTGGMGADIYIVDDVGDQVIEVTDWAWTSVDEVRTSLPVYVLPANVERLVGTSTTGQMLSSQGGTIVGGIGNDIISVGDGAGTGLGGDGDDLLTGGAGRDYLAGGAGSDILYGYDGNDILVAGEAGGASYSFTGNDYLDGGVSDDWLVGASGNDILIGGMGDDNLQDDRYGSDLLDGGDGNDIFLLARNYGAPAVGQTSLLGGAGNDDFSVVLDNAIYSPVLIDGGIGNDRLTILRLSGLLTVNLGAGADVIYLSDYIAEVNPNGRVVVTDFDLGAGGDALDWSAFLHAWLTGWNGTTNPFQTGHVRLGQSGTSTVLQFDRNGGGDAFTTYFIFQNTNAANFGAAQLGYQPVGQAALVGGDGNDFLSFGWGQVVDGGSGVDTLDISLSGASAGVVLDAAQVVGTGSFSLGGGAIQNVERISSVQGSNYADSLNLAGAGMVVTVNGGGGDDSILGTSGSDRLAGDDGQDWVIGGGDADTITGGDGHDTLWGDEGNDVLVGGEGDDVIAGGAGIDTVSYALASAGVEINLSYREDQLTRGAGVDTLISIENVIGSSFADILAGDEKANILTGGAGNDRFIFNGLGARDTISDFAAGDLIDLSAIDANGAAAGEGAFAFIGSAGFSGVAGQLRVTGSNLSWTVEADTNGDHVADFGISITLATQLAFTESLFIL